MTHSYLLSLGYSSSPTGMLSRGVKGGIKLDFDMLVAYNEERYLVPLEHPEAVIFAGVTMSKARSDDPQEEERINADVINYILDNSTGQDGDKPGGASNGQWGIPVGSLTQPLDLSLQDLGQQIYASANRTLHKTPGKGRFPIGVYLMTAPSLNNSSDEGSTELYHYIDSQSIAPRYKA